MKGRKYVIDTLEDKTNETQEKISSLRKWNCTELGMLEAKEVNLEASLIEVKSKNEELKARAEEKVQQITNIKGIYNLFKAMFLKKFLEPFVLSVPWYFSLAHLHLWRGK